MHFLVNRPKMSYTRLIRLILTESAYFYIRNGQLYQSLIRSSVTISAVKNAVDRNSHTLKLEHGKCVLLRLFNRRGQRMINVSENNI